MGNYLNPGNSGFSGIRNDIYVDKSGLIGLINQTIDTPRRLTCISRPRRFGKSFAAKMLCAYYDKTCDSAGLFDDLKIAQDKGYREHLNRYDVIYLDMTEAIGEASVEEVVPYIQRNVSQELTEQYPDVKSAEGFSAMLANAAEAAGNKFVMIIDEWDAPTELIGGVETEVDTKGFANDLTTFRDRDDVLTLLIHLGYLTYNEETRSVHIPNQEIRQEFARAIRQVKRDDTIRRVRESEQLIADTVQGNEEAVARQVEKIHEEESPLYYNNEQALRSVIKRAYFSYGNEYVMFEELPAGSGYADVVYLPKKNSPLPVLIVELKWKKSADSALEQIRDRRYPETVRDFGSDILLVGISYDKDAPAGERRHRCRIERYEERTEALTEVQNASHHNHRG